MNSVEIESNTIVFKQFPRHIKAKTIISKFLQISGQSHSLSKCERAEATTGGIP